VDNHPISAQSVEIFYGIKGKSFQRQYKEKISTYKSWTQKNHAEDYILNNNNISSSLAIDETALTNGELYTIVTNKGAKGKKGSIVAMVKGTVSSNVIDILMKIPRRLRDKVQEITLDMAASMNLIAKTCFRKATLVTDRFHVQKLAFDAVQEVRIKHRWEEIEIENNGYLKAKQEGKIFKTKVLSNGDSPKQILARSRYLLFKTPNKWTDTQKQRATILFAQYPDIKQAYELSCELSDIYNRKIDKSIALTKMARWFKDAEESGFKSFNTIRNTFEQHYTTILNYFENRATNAYAESFNSKIKDFRRNFRGVRDTKFFLFRLNTIFG
jgi:transposase